MQLVLCPQLSSFFMYLLIFYTKTNTILNNNYEYKSNGSWLVSHVPVSILLRESFNINGWLLPNITSCGTVNLAGQGGISGGASSSAGAGVAGGW